MQLSKILTLAFTLILPLGLVSVVGCSGAKSSDTSAPSAIQSDIANSSDSASSSPTSSRLTDEQINMIDLQSKIINTIGLGSIKDREFRYE